MSLSQTLEILSANTCRNGEGHCEKDCHKYNGENEVDGCLDGYGVLSGWSFIWHRCGWSRRNTKNLENKGNLKNNSKKKN